MQITRRTVLDTGIWQIGQVDVTDASLEPGEEELQTTNVLVLPVAGVFAKHEAGQRVLGTPNDAVVIRADRPYRLSYPAGIGDRCLTIRFSDEVAAEIGTSARRERHELSEATLLSASAMLLRNTLWRRFRADDWDPIEVEELGHWLLEQVLPARGAGSTRGRQLSVDRAAIEVVKEAIISKPAHPWTLTALGREASVSPYHLSRMFRIAVGTSIYRYVLRSRLAVALDLLATSEFELTEVGLASGFSSHSHFAARFRAFFGITPSAFRRAADAGSVEPLRRIVTAANH
jgi:AraC-like DNA-binding protein